MVVAVTVAGPACNAQCRGPGCEAEWPATVVSVIPEDALRGATDPEGDAIATYEGLDAHGAGWAVGTFARMLLFGQPEVGQVLRVPFREGTGRWERSRKWTGPEGFGATVATADFDGDGTLDLLVGAPDAEFDRGSVFLFRNATSGPTAAEEAALEIRGGTAADRLGERLVACADITGDGLPDALAAMPWMATPGADAFAGVRVRDLAGGVALFASELMASAEGVAEPWDLGAVWWGEAVGDGAGWALACDRDLTGDGWPDVVIGAPWADGEAGRDAGRVYVLDGAELAGGPLPTVGPLAEVAVGTVEGADNAWLGMAVATLELDGEAPAELAIGAPGYGEAPTGNDRLVAVGRVHVSRDLPLTRGYVDERLHTFTRASDQADHFGRWLAVGDLDVDGRSDLIVGAPDLRERNNEYDAGRAWVFRGSSADFWLPEDTEGIADHRVVGDRPFQRVGRAPLVWDADGDGADDLVLPTRRAARQD